MTRSVLKGRVAVKNTATMERLGQVSFNPRTLHLVDRVMILRVNTEEMQLEILFDASVEGGAPTDRHKGLRKPLTEVIATSQKGIARWSRWPASGDVPEIL